MDIANLPVSGTDYEAGVFVTAFFFFVLLSLLACGLDISWCAWTVLSSTIWSDLFSFCNLFLNVLTIFPLFLSFLPPFFSF